MINLNSACPVVSHTAKSFWFLQFCAAFTAALVGWYYITHPSTFTTFTARLIQNRYIHPYIISFYCFSSCVPLLLFSQTDFHTNFIIARSSLLLWFFSLFSVCMLAFCLLHFFGGSHKTYNVMYLYKMIYLYKYNNR